MYDVCGGLPGRGRDHGQQAITHTLEVGSVILAPGAKTYDPSRIDTYLYGHHPNVVTSLEFERILSASGPYHGPHGAAFRPQEPKKIAWLQCVGSRNINQCDNGYCSAVCCMYAIKEAVIAKEHSPTRLDTAIFFMDMRTYGKEFEKYYNRAQDDRGALHPLPGASIDPAGRWRLIPRLCRRRRREARRRVRHGGALGGLGGGSGDGGLGQTAGDRSQPAQLCRDRRLCPGGHFPPGVYTCGLFQGPKDIPLSVMEASAAAWPQPAIWPRPAGTETKSRELPPERDVSGEEPRVGVFVCNCGINIARSWMSRR